jgi:hypothetical protein
MLSFLAQKEVMEDAITVRRVYIDIAGGDLVAGVILSQLVYWHSPRNDHKGIRLQVWHDKKVWLARKSDDWWEDCRVTGRQAKRGLEILAGKTKVKGVPTINAPLIETHIYKFNGAPTTHVRILWKNLQEAFDRTIQKCQDELEHDLGEYADDNGAILPKRTNPLYPNDQMEHDEMSESITESSSEITSQDSIPAKNAGEIGSPENGDAPEARPIQEGLPLVTPIVALSGVAAPPARRRPPPMKAKPLPETEQITNGYYAAIGVDAALVSQPEYRSTQKQIRELMGLDERGKPTRFKGYTREEIVGCAGELIRCGVGAHVQLIAKVIGEYVGDGEFPPAWCKPKRTRKSAAERKREQEAIELTKLAREQGTIT